MGVITDINLLIIIVILIPNYTELNRINFTCIEKVSSKVKNLKPNQRSNVS